MNDVAAGNDTINPLARRRSRIVFLGILAVFAVPLLLATIWLHMVRSSGGALGDTSRGELIRPAVPLTAFELPAADQSFNLDTVQGIWTLMYLPAGHCLDVCEKNLYHMRQVRLALNHRMDRVQRAVIINASEPLDDALVAEHPGLIVVSESADEVLSAQIRAAQTTMPAVSDAIYLIDPFGNLMMRFAPDLSPKSMLKDIKHLLKVSRIG